ncbi:MAG: hypothetical protein SGJ11_02520 [Phycisphaerae bacterium]|nr:hypothetical protein [Phycisphaerae bacterium]
MPTAVRFVEPLVDSFFDSFVDPSAADGDSLPMNDQATASDDDEDRVLRALLEGTSRATGQRFFESLVRHLARGGCWSLCVAIRGAATAWSAAGSGLRAGS